MEAISQEEAGGVPKQEAPLFTKRGADFRHKHLCPRDDLKRPERPRTALATMRTNAQNAHPEFERRSSGQGGEPGNSFSCLFTFSENSAVCYIFRHRSCCHGRSSP